MKLVRKLQTVKNKEGKEITVNNFYLVLDGGFYIAIKPVFDDDKKLLKAFSEKE